MPMQARVCSNDEGTLREPLSHLDRAGLFLLTKTDQSSQFSRQELRDTLDKYNGDAPIIESIHHPKNFVEIADWYKGIHENAKDLSELQGKKVMVFSAIGNPSSFEQTLACIGIDIIEADDILTIMITECWKCSISVKEPSAKKL